jgi:hypothetical protein
LSVKAEVGVKKSRKRTIVEVKSLKEFRAAATGNQLGNFKMYSVTKKNDEPDDAIMNDSDS